MIEWMKKWNSWWFHKEVEFLLLIFGVFVFVGIAKTYAKSPEAKAAEIKDQTIYRMFKEIEEVETKFGRSYIIHVMIKSDDPIPVLNWNPDVDYYLLYPNGYPQTSPHTSEIHFDLMAHMLDTDVAIYRGKSINHLLGPNVKPCPICKGLLEHDK